MTDDQDCLTEEELDEISGKLFRWRGRGGMTFTYVDGERLLHDVRTWQKAYDVTQKILSEKHDEVRELRAEVKRQREWLTDAARQTP